MLGKLLLLPLWGPVKGLVSVAEAVQEMVDKELNDPDEIKKRLIELQMELELEKITEDEYMREEERLLKKLDEIEQK
ncbi:MAG: gas vesicle protein GvpG [Bacillota bacterium]